MAAATSVAAVLSVGLVGAVLILPTCLHAEDRRLLAAELLVATGDLARLSEPDLGDAHRKGLHDRLNGALGLLPWLLEMAGDATGAGALTAAYGKGPVPGAELGALLARLSARHSLGLGSPGSVRVSATAMREARLIHQSYCAGCHDGAGNGDRDTRLPARDLYLMGRSEPSDVLFARLINGIKGDETIGFRNPMSEEQLRALWKLYLSGG